MALATVIALTTPLAAIAAPPSVTPSRPSWSTGLEGASGSTVGPDGALYVTEGAAGRISRVDPKTGDITTFASGLPQSIIGFGGAMDVEFIGQTAYVLVTLVGPDVGGSDIVGIYRVDGPDSFTVVADIGAFAVSESAEHSVRSRNRSPVCAGDATVAGSWSPMGTTTGCCGSRWTATSASCIAFDNIVPTGLAVRGSKVYMAEAGPVPHLPEDGKVVSFGHEVVHRHGGRLRRSPPRRRRVRPRSDPLCPLAGRLRRRPRGCSGAAEHRQPREGQPGRHASRVVADGLDRPTSLEFIGNTAYVVTLGGEIWKLDSVSCPPCGVSH